MKKALTLKDLQEDKEKALRDMQLMQQQLIGVQFLLAYLNQKIKQLEVEEK